MPQDDGAESDDDMSTDSKLFPNLTDPERTDYETPGLRPVRR